MFEKAGRYFADWRDASGKRIRKSFTSKRAALQFESDQKELAHPKPQALGHVLPKSYAPPRRGTAKRSTATTKPPRSSSRKLVPFRRPN